MSIIEKDPSFVPSWAEDIPDRFKTMTTEGPLPKEESVYIPTHSNISRVIEIPVGAGSIPMPTGGQDILVVDIAHGKIEKNIALLPKIDPSFQKLVGLFLEAIEDDNLADDMGADLWQQMPQVNVGSQGIEFKPPQLEEPEDEEDDNEFPLFTLNGQGFSLHPDLNPNNLAIEPGIWYHSSIGDFLIEQKEDWFNFNFWYDSFNMEDLSEEGKVIEYRIVAKLSVRNTDYSNIQAEINNNLSKGQAEDEGNLRQFVDYQVVAQNIPS